MCCKILRMLACVLVWLLEIWHWYDWLIGAYSHSVNSKTALTCYNLQSLSLSDMTGYIFGSTCSILSFFFLFGWMHNSVPHLPNLKGSRIIWTIDRMSVNLLWFISFHFYSITEQSIALLVCTPIRCQLIRQMLFVTWVVYNEAFLPSILDDFLCWAVFFKALGSLKFILSTITLALFLLALLHTHIYTQHKAKLLHVTHNVTKFYWSGLWLYWSQMQMSWTGSNSLNFKSLGPQQKRQCLFT